MEKILKKDGPDVGLANIVNLANERGGPDNITAILARIENLADTAEMDSGGAVGAERAEPDRRAEFDAPDPPVPGPSSHAAATYPIHGDDNPRAVEGGGRRSARQTTLLLIVAFIVLVMLVGVMGLVVSRLSSEAKQLSQSDATTQPRGG